jgi:hypothetical protein
MDGNTYVVVISDEDVRDADYLSGHLGGIRNTHKGTIEYDALIEFLQWKYCNLTNFGKKNKLELSVLDFVFKRDGRFLQKHDKNEWIEVFTKKFMQEKIKRKLSFGRGKRREELWRMMNEKEIPNSSNSEVTEMRGSDIIFGPNYTNCGKGWRTVRDITYRAILEFFSEDISSEVLHLIVDGFRYQKCRLLEEKDDGLRYEILDKCIAREKISLALVAYKANLRTQSTIQACTTHDVKIISRCGHVWKCFWCRTGTFFDQLPIDLHSKLWLNSFECTKIWEHVPISNRYL